MKTKSFIKKTLLISGILCALTMSNTGLVVAATCGVDRTDKDNPKPIQTSIDLNCDNAKGANENPIFTYLRAIVKFAGALVGVGLVLVIIFAGIRWTMSQGNPQGIEAAQKLLFAGVSGLIAFIFTVALLNYLIPGGVFG